MCPHITPSPYSDLPAPLRMCSFHVPLASILRSHGICAQLCRPIDPCPHPLVILLPFPPLVLRQPAQTLYTNPSPPPVARNSRPERVAILADIQAFHEVMANQAKDVWDKTVVAGTGGVREGEVVTSFLYACKVGSKSLGIAPCNRPPLAFLCRHIYRSHDRFVLQQLIKKNLVPRPRPEDCTPLKLTCRIDRHFIALIHRTHLSVSASQPVSIVHFACHR